MQTYFVVCYVRQYTQGRMQNILRGARLAFCNREGAQRWIDRIRKTGGIGPYEWPWILAGDPAIVEIKKN